MSQKPSGATGLCPDCYLAVCSLCDLCASCGECKCPTSRRPDPLGAERIDYR
jgi:hypothetical protein